MNATGYTATKWSQLLEDERVEEEQMEPRVEADQLENEEGIAEISRRMATRFAAKNKDLICSI